MALRSGPWLQSPIFEFADRFISEQSALDPCLATGRGIPGYDDQLTDFSPAGPRSTSRSRAIGRRRTGCVDAHRRQRSPRQGLHPRAIRDVDALARRWRMAASASRDRSAHVDASQHVRPDAARRRRGMEEHRRPPARDPWCPGRPASDIRRRSRQRHRRRSPPGDGGCRPVRDLGRQPLVRHTGAPRQRTRDDVSAALHDDIVAGADKANTAYSDFADYLRDDYAPDADPVDGCGIERYKVGVRTMLGRRPRSAGDVRVGVDRLPPPARGDRGNLRSASSPGRVSPRSSTCSTTIRTAPSTAPTPTSRGSRHSPTKR